MRKETRLLHCLVACMAALAAIGPARAAAPTVVVFPVEGAQPVADDLTSGLVMRLSGADCGLKALAFDRNSPTVQRAVREHDFLRTGLGSVTSAVVADMLGAAVGADLSLMGKLAVQEGQAKFSVRLAAPKTRLSREFDAAAALPQGWPDSARSQDMAALVESLLAPVARQICAEGGPLSGQAPSDPAEHFKRGQEALSQGKAVEAALEFNIATALAPGNADWHVATGDAYAAMDDPQGALIEYNRALQITPGMPSARMKLALLYLKMGKGDEAMRIAESLLENDPANAQARLVLARGWAAQGEQSKSLAQYERLLSDQPNNEEALRAVASAYDDKQQWDRALPAYSRLVQVAPGDDHARERLIQLYVKVGNLTQAVAELRKAYDLLGEPVRYQMPQFVAVVRMTDREFLATVREAASAWEDYQTGKRTTAQLKEAFTGLHDRSDNLYRAADKMVAPELLTAAHRFRLLAYALLNEADFEMVRFAKGEERWRRERAEMLQESAQTALVRAHKIEADAGWPTVTEAER